MRIGIVCEGATDTHAIVSFLGASLKSRGVGAAFVGLQPNMDRTSPNGGWGLVLMWFEKNPASSRGKTYFGRGCSMVVYLQNSATRLSFRWTPTIFRTSLFETV